MIGAPPAANPGGTISGISSVKFAEALEWLDDHSGRTVRVIVYRSGDSPFVDLEGPLAPGVPQSASVFASTESVRNVVVYEVGNGNVALDEAAFADAEVVGASLAVRLVDGAEVVVFPMRAE